MTFQEILYLAIRIINLFVQMANISVECSRFTNLRKSLFQEILPPTFFFHCEMMSEDSEAWRSQKSLTFCFSQLKEMKEIT